MRKLIRKRKENQENLALETEINTLKATDLTDMCKRLLSLQEPKDHHRWSSIFAQHKLIEPIIAEFKCKIDKLTSAVETSSQLPKKAKKLKREDDLIGGRSRRAPTSTFLSSLSGQTFFDDSPARGSRDDADDELREMLGEKPATKKKNRPGQQARQKRGRERERFEAKKLGIEIAQVEEPRRKASKRESKRTLTKASTVPHEGRRSQSTTTSATVKASEVIEPSHPSWKAKQAMKEKEKVDITAFCGKKITFD